MGCLLETQLTEESIVSWVLPLYVILDFSRKKERGKEKEELERGEIQSHHPSYKKIPITISSSQQSSFHHYLLRRRKTDTLRSSSWNSCNSNSWSMSLVERKWFMLGYLAGWRWTLDCLIPKPGFFPLSGSFLNMLHCPEHHCRGSPWYSQTKLLGLYQTSLLGCSTIGSVWIGFFLPYQKFSFLKFTTDEVLHWPCQHLLFKFFSRKLFWRSTPMELMVFPGDSDGKESACNVGELGLIPGLARSTEEGNGNPLQYSCLKSPMDRRP